MYKKYDNKEEFANRLDSVMRFYFWSKCEHGVIIAPWVGNAKEMKIDVYDQLHMNWDKFVDYVWDDYMKRVCKFEYYNPILEKYQQIVGRLVEQYLDADDPRFMLTDYTVDGVLHRGRMIFRLKQLKNLQSAAMQIVE